MEMPRRYVGLRFQIDTNRINARQGLPSMNQLEIWARNGVIELEISERALQEAMIGNNTERTAKAIDHIFSMTYADTNNEQNRLRNIQQILFPGGVKDRNQKNDVEIVFNAGKYCYTLITNDGGSKSQPGGILGNAYNLKKQLDIDVVSDSEAVNLVQRRIRDRDALCRRISKEYSQPLPEWIGAD